MSYPIFGSRQSSFLLAATVCWFAGLCAGCRTAPITGRPQMMLQFEETEVALGLSAFQEITAKEPPSTNAKYIELVQRVGQRIAAVSGRQDYQWEFRVLASPTKNAFCLPGGKVAVYEGIIPVCQNEAGLAVVMSHEIGHALARHGGERMSQSKAVDVAKQGLSYITQTQDAAKQEMIMRAYGMGAQYGVILPYSRKHESEADHIGLMLMARAGYNPEEAPRFWQRFASSKDGPQPWEFMSTHPTDQRRASDLAALLPQAMENYLKSANRYDLGEMIVVNPSPETARQAASLTLPAGGVVSGTNDAASTLVSPATANIPALRTANLPASFTPPPAFGPVTRPNVDGWMPKSETMRR